MAALKAGVIDALVLTAFTMAPLKVKGEARELVSLREYLPKEWTGLIVTAQKKFLESKPDAARGAVRVLVRSTAFVMKNPQWSIEKMKSFFGYSDELANHVYRLLNYKSDGRINRNALINCRNLLVENQLIPKEKSPSPDELYREGFAQ